MQRFKNQVAVVTGSSSGNGRAIALALADGGAKVVCSDINKAARKGGYERDLDIDTDDVIRGRGGESIFVRTDASKAADIQNLIGSAVDRFGRVDVLVNNAGVFTGLKTIVDETEEEYDFTMGVNAKSVWLGCKYAITRMLEQEPRADGVRGRIINIASIGGLVGLAQEAAYCASKGAVVNLTRQLAVDFAPERISVNAVCPGFLATAMVRPFLEDPSLKEGVESLTPWPRFGKADDVANAVCFLASDDADWVTGSMLTVDGAFTAR